MRGWRQHRMNRTVWREQHGVCVCGESATIVEDLLALAPVPHYHFTGQWGGNWRGSPVHNIISGAKLEVMPLYPADTLCFSHNSMVEFWVNPRASPWCDDVNSSPAAEVMSHVGTLPEQQSEPPPQYVPAGFQQQLGGQRVLVWPSFPSVLKEDCSVALPCKWSLLSVLCRRTELTESRLS